jgi:hypothetical protein
LTRQKARGVSCREIVDRDDDQQQSLSQQHMCAPAEKKTRLVTANAST